MFNLMIKAGVSNFGPLEEKKDSKGKHSHDKPLACRFVMVTNKSSGHRPTSCWIHVSGQWNLQILNSGLVLLLQIKTCVSLAFNVDVWLSALLSLCGTVLCKLLRIRAVLLCGNVAES